MTSTFGSVTWLLLATAGNQAEKEQKQDGKATGSPSQQWEIDYNQITILEKIGDGAFGEVFKGRLWGTDVRLIPTAFPPIV